MNNWINLHALWQIIVIGILAGAGLPALFAVGLLALNPAVPAGASATASAPRTAGYAVAGLCFAVVLAAVGWGVYAIVAGS